MSNTGNQEEKSEKRDTSRVNTRTREERREQAEREWRLRPIEQFLKEREGEITSSDLQSKERTVRRFDRYLHEEIAPRVNASILDLRDVVEADIALFRDDELKPDPSLADRTVANKLGALSHFYNILEENNAFAGNPVKGPLKTFKQNHNLESDRPHIPFHRMQRFVNWLTLPFSRAFWLSGFKHGTRFSEVINIDLRCLHIDHPVFWQIVENHDVRLDPRVRDKPDTLLIYEGFNEGDEIPNEETPGPETEGEIRDSAKGNKRKEDGGSILPLDSELKTALIEWLLVRPPTHNHVVNPLFVFAGSNNVRRPTDDGINMRLWQQDSYTDSIQHFGAEESLDECPDCGGSVIEENLEQGEKPGRRFRCRDCRTEHWRSIYWDNGLVTEQKMTYHVARHYFSNAHSPAKSELHDGAIPDRIRKKRIRGDSDNDGDTEDQTYMTASYEQYDEDVREPYLDGIYKFDLYDSVIPAVGEGWQR